MRTSASSPIKAVLFLDRARVLAPLFSAWRNAGHQIAAIVTLKTQSSSRKRRRDRWLGYFAPDWSISAQVKKLFPDCPWIEVPPDTNWDELASRLESLQPDILISAYFQKRIPEKILSLFPHGGVNLHPARLPHFRGPHPIHQMVLQDAWRECGGVSLHRMTQKFDEGDLIAFAHLKPSCWQTNLSLDQGIAGAIAKLVGDGVPAYCRGERNAVAQPSGQYAWASLVTEIGVKHTWSRAHFSRIMSLLGRNRNIFLTIDGKKIRLHADVETMGPPSGLPPRMAAGRVEFDLTDTRVACARSSGLKRRLAEIGFTLALRHAKPDNPQIIFASESNPPPI